MIKIGNSVSTFQWSTQEQIYPFDKDINGKTLYCKYIDIGNCPSSGYIQVAHGISEFVGANIKDKLWDMKSMLYGNTGSPYALSADDRAGVETLCVITQTNAVCAVGQDYSGYHMIVRLIYSK